VSGGEAKIAVMVSGGGRTLANLADRIDRGELPAKIVLVIASADCPAVARAEERGIHAVVMPGVIPEAELERALRGAGAEFVVLGGYLKKVNIPPAYRGKVINIHPALLPAFGGEGMYGRRVHEAVLAAGCDESGCTAHLCDADYDTGPIVMQRRCRVLRDDTPQSLAARVFALEQEMYPEAIRAMIEGRTGAR
jgi:phosphoribosylglycinamide formyltransferase-1